VTGHSAWPFPEMPESSVLAGGPWLKDVRTAFNAAQSSGWTTDEAGSGGAARVSGSGAEIRDHDFRVHWRSSHAIRQATVQPTNTRTRLALFRGEGPPVVMFHRSADFFT